MAKQPGRLWRILDDSGVDYNFIGVEPGSWRGRVVFGTHDVVNQRITVEQPDSLGTYTASSAHFELVDCPINYLIQLTDGDGCYYWMGPAPQCRPIIRVGKATKSARRILWETVVGPLTKSQVVVDICNQPMCMRPRHLRLKTRGQLVKDSRNK